MSFVRACGTSLVRWMALQCASVCVVLPSSEYFLSPLDGASVCVVLPSSDRWQQCVREAPLHAYSVDGVKPVDGTTTLIGRCLRERSVLLQTLSPSMVSCRRKAISLSVRQCKRYEHTLKHIYVGPTI